MRGLFRFMRRFYGYKYWVYFFIGRAHGLRTVGLTLSTLAHLNAVRLGGLRFIGLRLLTSTL